ncbi:MAG: GGDEF domain-containing protein [Gemmatimonadales bacterium]
MLLRLHHTLRRVPAWIIIAGSLLYLAGVVAVQYRTGPEIALGVFYLPAIAAVSWYCGSQVGIGMALLATVASGLAAWSRLPHPELSVVLWNSGAQLIFFHFAAIMVGTVARQTVRLANLAREDPLTGIPNRRAFFEELDRALEWGRRHYTPWVLAYVDVDDFKQINDGHGHAEGDEVLRLVARTLREATRRVDVVARVGGDEFALLLPETDGTQAERVIGHVIALLRERTRELTGGVKGKRVTFSTGVVTFAVSPASPDTALALADACMYGVKQNGKDGVAFREWP